MIPNDVSQGCSARGDYRLVPSEYPFVASDPAFPADVNAVVDSSTPTRNVTCCQRLEAVLHNTCFQACEALLIIANAAVIGMETDIKDYKHWNDIENGFLVIFLVELIFKIIVIGPGSYFDWNNDADFIWNVFDCMIVGLGCFDAISLLLSPSEGGGGNFATLFRMIRLLRILRIFRIVKFLKELYVLAFGLVEAVKAVFWVTVLMFFVLYVCSIVLVKTIGQTPPDDKNYDFLVYKYGTIVDSMLTLFVLMSSPNFVIYQDEEGLIDDYPPFVMFLVMFITFGSFGMIALLTGVISESMFQKNEVRKEQMRIEQEEMKQMITSKCEAMFEVMEKEDGHHELRVPELQKFSAELCQMLIGCGIQFSQMDMSRIIEFMDIDGTGMIGIDEFVKTMLKVADGLSPMSIQELQNRVGVVERKVDTLTNEVQQGFGSLQRGMQVIQRQMEDLAKTMRTR